MRISEFQTWLEAAFGERTDTASPEHLLALLLEQAGQLANAVMLKDEDNMKRQSAHLLFVVTALANRMGIDLPTAVSEHLSERPAEAVADTLHL